MTFDFAPTLEFKPEAAWLVTGGQRVAVAQSLGVVIDPFSPQVGLVVGRGRDA